MDSAGLYALLLAALPIIGRALLLIPFVPNKAIPFLLTAFNFIMKYWLILGFPTEVLPTPAPDAQLGGLFAFTIPWETIGVALWTLVENYLAHRFYEGKKYEAQLKGETSWWEKGKRDIWKPKEK